MLVEFQFDSGTIFCQEFILGGYLMNEFNEHGSVH